MPHIVATVTDHGLGHLSISAPVLNKLYCKIRNIKLTLISGLPEARLSARISAPFNYIHSAMDFGVRNDNRLSVRIDDTVAMYQALHANWPQQVKDYSKKLDRLNCDLLFSNVSYLSLAAAKSLGLPGLALSPLNWADMYKYFCHQARDYRRTHKQMLAAYAAADLFLMPTPSMPMPELVNTRQIGPIAASGADKKLLICKRLRIEPSTKLALVAMGGHDITFSATWPRHESIHWLVTRAWGANQPNVANLEDLDMPFIDLLASCDLLISKPGYGAFTEATCAGKPVLYVRRPDWPEESYLIQWLERHNQCGELTCVDLQNGSFIEDVFKLLDHRCAPTSPPQPTGLNEVTDLIIRLLR